MVKKSITCISLLFIGCGISYFYFDRYNNIKDISNNELLMGKFFENKVSNNQNKYKKNNKEKKKEYIAVLEIPKINFKRGLYEKKDPENDISKNIVFLDSSSLPNENNSKVIIAGHSGDTYNAYFKNLYKLTNKDIINLYYNNKKYIYKVSDIYEITKNGTLALESNKDKKTLTLITCKDSKRQLVIVSTLINSKG